MKITQITITAIIGLGLFAVSHVATAEDFAFAKIDVIYSTAANILDVTGTVYKTFSQNYALTIFDPQGRLISVSQIQLSQDNTFSQSINTSSVLWSKSGNYTVKMASGPQVLADESFYFPGISCCAQNSQEVQAGPSKKDTVIDSPLKQFRSGVAPKNVRCIDDLQLIFKTRDNSPACVKPDTAKKLTERGWEKFSYPGISTLANPPVGLSNLTLSTNPIILGIPFYIDAVVTNYESEPITYYGGCTSPLSVSFDTIKTSDEKAHCFAISKYTLEPNQSVPVQSSKIESAYNKASPDASTNAKIQFSYETGGKKASVFASMKIPIQNAIMIDCSGMNVLLHISQIDRTVNVTKAIALAYTSPDFLVKVRQYGNPSYFGFHNDWFSSESCHTYWNGTEVMFATSKETGTRNIQVTEDINLTKVIRVSDFGPVVANSNASQGNSKNAGASSNFTINSGGGATKLTPSCPICTPEYFNETETYTGNVGKIIPGYPILVKVSDPYTISPKTYTVPASAILANGTFHYTIAVTGKFGMNQYTLKFIYGNQSLTRTLPVLPP